MTPTVRLNRRDSLKSGVAFATIVGPLTAQNPSSKSGRFQIGACDWSLGLRGKPDALALAKQLGLDGVQVSMGGLEDDLHLRRADVQRAYREAASAHGVRVGGVALDIMNRVPYKSDPRTEEWVSDSIDVARALGVRVVLLAFFEKGIFATMPPDRLKSCAA
jgi:L-ribulose-5-phosphate 3-epimerase